MLIPPYCSATKWLTKVLETFREEVASYSFKGAFNCVQLIEEINIKNKQIPPTDVQNFFTNLCLSKTIDHFCNYIKNDNIE